MYSKTLALALALTAAVSSSPLHKRQSADACQATYKTCIASGVPEVACQCDLTSCVGEDAARIREWCASATATIVRSSTASTPVATSIPGGCNPAHPGSCPDSYFSTTATTLTPAHTSTPCPSASKAPTTSIPGIPGGCNPAHPGSCPDSYFSTTTAPATHPTATPAAPAPAGSNPVKTDKTWKITNLTRYCAEDNTGCDYNFSVTSADGKTAEKCTVIRMPGAKAATESWSDQPCTSGSVVKVSWGYAAEPAPAFAVMSVVDGKEVAWFGVSDVNGQKVSPSNPFGSGQWAELASPVYVYN